jgi:hypothetical protein
MADPVSWLMIKPAAGVLAGDGSESAKSTK